MRTTASRYSIGVAALAAVTALPAANAQSMHGLDELDAAAFYSDQYAGQQLWIKREWDGIPQYFSAVRLNQHWGLTAGHGFEVGGFVFENLEIGAGTNYMTDPGQTRAVVEYHLHPAYNPHDPFRWGSIDLAVFRWDEPLPGTDAVIGSLSLNERFTYAGFGRPATPHLGDLDHDGKRRAFDVRARRWGKLDGTISQHYVETTFFNPGSSGFLPMGGNARSGNSGSGGYNEDGELVALAVAGSNNGYRYLSRTYGVRLDLFEQWIMSHIDPDPPCPPDWNGDGVVDSDDLLDFLSDWAAGNADYNNDGVTDSDDLLLFLADWSTGC